MSTTHRDVDARVTWLFRLAGAATVTAALTLAATTTATAATTTATAIPTATTTAAAIPAATTTAAAVASATAFAESTPGPDSDDRNDDRNDDHSDDRTDPDDRRYGDSGDRTDDDSETDSELEPGPRMGNSSTGPREQNGEEHVVEVHGKWRFHTIAGAQDWRETPNGQLVVTSDDVWVEVTGGPRSWCVDGATGQQRFPKTRNAIVRCG